MVPCLRVTCDLLCNFDYLFARLAVEHVVSTAGENIDSLAVSENKSK